MPTKSLNLQTQIHLPCPNRTYMAPLIQEEEDTMILFSSLFDTDDGQNGFSDDLIFEFTGEKKVVGKRRRRRSRREGEEAKKRKLSEEQVKFLETSFGEERKLESSRKVLLASEAGLEPKQVAVWFQNRRARWKNKKLEDEYSILKSEHQAAIVQNSHLETEVLKLKEQLTEAETKIRKLAGNADRVSGHGGEMISSPSSTSFSVNTTTHYQPFGTGEDQIVYLNEHNYVNMLDWEVFFGI